MTAMDYFALCFAFLSALVAQFSADRANKRIWDLQDQIDGLRAMMLADRGIIRRKYEQDADITAPSRRDVLADPSEVEQ